MTNSIKTKYQPQLINLIILLISDDAVTKVDLDINRIVQVPISCLGKTET